MRVAELYSCDLLTTVAAYRSGGLTSGVGGQPVESNSLLGSYSIMLERLSGGQAQRAFGDQSTSRWRVTSDVEGALAVDDLLVVTSGPHTGEYIELDDRWASPSGVVIFSARNTERRP
jgi:hypothetical protein